MSRPVARRRNRGDPLAKVSTRAAPTARMATPIGSTAYQKEPGLPALKMEKEVRPLPAGTRKIGSPQAQMTRIAPTAAAIAATGLDAPRRPGAGPGRRPGGGPGRGPGTGLQGGAVWVC